MKLTQIFCLNNLFACSPEIYKLRAFMYATTKTLPQILWIPYRVQKYLSQINNPYCNSKPSDPTTCNIKSKNVKTFIKPNKCRKNEYRCKDTSHGKSNQLGENQRNDARIPPLQFEFYIATLTGLFALSQSWPTTRNENWSGQSFGNRSRVGLKIGTRISSEFRTILCE